MIQTIRRRIAWDARRSEELTTIQDNELQRRRLLLLRQLKQFRNLQVLYMPAASLMLDEAEELQGQLPEAERPHPEVEHQALWLPSALPTSHREHNCSQRLIDIEIQLRRAQCNDTLDKIRSLQRGRLSFISFRNRHIRGQYPSTRARDTIDRLEDKSKALALKYRDARCALYTLLGPGDWEKELRELNHGDLTTPDGHEISIEDPNDPVGPDGRPLSMSKKKKRNLELGLGEGRRTVSWIWTSTAAIGDGADKVLHEGLFLVRI